MKHTVQAVILNEDKKTLGVSRKDNHNDFGLPGGKVEEGDFNFDPDVFHSPFHAACHREVMEETGLDIDMSTAVMVFAMHKDGYMGYTFFVSDWDGKIEYDEPHVVKWVPFEALMNGSFGKYNTLVSESLTDMGIEFEKDIDIHALSADIKEYIESTIMKGYTKPFKFDGLSNSWAGIGKTVHLKGGDGYPPEGDWDSRDEEFESGLRAVGLKHYTHLNLPSSYLMK